MGINIGILRFCHITRSKFLLYRMFKLLAVLATLTVLASGQTFINKPYRARPLITIERIEPVVTRELVRPVIKAVPVPVGREGDVTIVSLRNVINPEGSYDYAYQTSNGIAAQESAEVRAVGPEQVAKAAQGSFSWTSPEGVTVQMQYVADENGYQPTGNAIPVGPAIPAAIQRSLEWIAAHPQQETLPSKRYQ